MGITYGLCPFAQLRDQLIQNSETVMGLVELLIGIRIFFSFLLREPFAKEDNSNSS